MIFGCPLSALSGRLGDQPASPGTRRFWTFGQLLGQIGQLLGQSRQAVRPNA